MKIYVDGLERSGNMFLCWALGNAVNIDIESKKTHTLDILENYTNDFPFIVPLRDALPSMTSAKVYLDRFALKNPHITSISSNSTMQKIIDKYLKYTQYLLDHPEFFIAPFHEFTKDHNKVIDVIIKTYPSLKREHTSTSQEIMDNAAKKNKDIYDPYLGHFPREEAKEKSQIEFLFITNHIEEILQIQRNIDKLYERYYSLEL
jgi:hypothetical protein